jgi:hypothetical protein
MEKSLDCWHWPVPTGLHSNVQPAGVLDVPVIDAVPLRDVGPDNV